MEENRGRGWGSYIWGRSVHNTRIERLWYDITHGYGQKWKNFFHDLEVHHSLNPQLSQHIWLLHHLFLEAIDADAQDWMHAWNSHKLRINGERTRSPRDMFIFSMLQDGSRGLDGVVTPAEEEGEIDPATYGVDWQVAAEPRFMNHLFQQNPQELGGGNPFSNAPDHQAHVPCVPPNCPFTVEQVQWLNETLAAEANLRSRSMQMRRLVWVKGLELCQELWNA